MAAKTEGAGVGGALKRLLVGRALSTSSQEHQLLPKILALPVFASDQLSSVAYATEEMMLVLALAGASALGLLSPLGIGVAILLIVVIVSYRQTVRAYPRGGGSYIVAKENLGTVPGLTAAGAILSSYVLTVSVSVTAGAIAVTSAAPGLADHKVALATSFVVLITVANLRGAKEAGKVFAIPTYGFVVVVGLTLGWGVVRCVSGGCPQAASANLPLHAEASLSLFLVLRAFSSGATALTGVEAIADGVQAFRRPQAKNAAATLLLMGAMSIPMFLGITIFARLLHVRVNHDLASSKSVLAQIGDTIFSGGAMFIVLQIFTAAILILAANTAYQDFPRLASILARDRYMPSQFMNRGDRLVFSNGVIVLGLLSCLMIYTFGAELGVLINFYVVGVFTSFTLSQSGMVRHWLAEGRKGSHAFPGWRRATVINAIGAVTTLVVLVVVIVSKAPDGAWLSILIMAALVPVFVMIHRHYRAVAAELARERPNAGAIEVGPVILLVRDLDAATAEALGYVRAMRPARSIALHPVTDGSAPDEVADRWRAWAGDGIPLDVRPGAGLIQVVRDRLRALDRGPHEVVTIVIPELVSGRLLTYLLRRW
ncbi:MAG: APC family permease, partial [Actinomycetota bacterium]